MDEYDDIELFHKMAQRWRSEDPADRDPKAEEVVTKNHPNFAKLVDPSTPFPPEMKLYNVIDALTLEFEPCSRAAAIERDNDEWWRLPEDD
jgi:hypothetical protein